MCEYGTKNTTRNTPQTSTFIVPSISNHHFHFTTQACHHKRTLTQPHYDNLVFVLKTQVGLVVVIDYVDDRIVSYSDVEGMAEVKNKLKHTFKQSTWAKCATLALKSHGTVVLLAKGLGFNFYQAVP